jgi:hypothetical protein
MPREWLPSARGQTPRPELLLELAAQAPPANDRRRIILAGASFLAGAEAMDVIQGSQDRLPAPGAPLSSAALQYHEPAALLIGKLELPPGRSFGGLMARRFHVA